MKTIINRLKIFGELVKIEHTLFSLPFAFVGGILAARGVPSIEECLWIALAVVGARSAGMAWNRLVDQMIDQRNPRTADRVMPEKRISTKEVILWIIVSIGVFAVASWELNPICLALLPIAVLITFFYSYTKRFTWLCHLFLGLCLGLAPVGAWIGIRGGVAFDAVIIGLGVTFWTAGFDIIYSTLDIDFDREEGLHSIPVHFGLRRALQISLLMHLISLVLFVGLKFSARLSNIYVVALVFIAFLLFLENRLVSPDNLAKVNIAFFQINSLVSITFLIFILLEFGL